MNRPADADPNVEAFIARLNERYSPTKRLKANEEALDAAWDDYRRVLVRFDKPTMDLAWRLTVESHDSWCLPTVKDIVEACVHAQREIHPPGEADAWFDKATKLADAYTQRFMKTSKVASRAREGGYEGALKEYVWEASWVQAQTLAGRLGGVGYNAAVLFPGGEEKTERDAWIERAQAQAASSGQIKVTVTAELMKQWQAEVGSKGQRR